MIPFNRVSFDGHELTYVREAAASGHIAGNGPFSRRCEAWLERKLGVAKALLTTSCTHALELAALTLELETEDEVVVPSYTFVSTANAFALRGARPVFIDVRPDTLNMDETLVARAVTPRTRAIVPVHYAGVGCEMDVIEEVARENRVPIIEDNAHGLLGRYREKHLGTFGAFAALSFHETKNVTCGEGGALLINDESLVARAEIIREKGTDRSRFFRGEVEKYSWRSLGSSFVPSDILAAILLAQFERIDAIQAERRRVWESYAERLTDWAARCGAVLPTVPAHTDSSYHMFHILCPTAERRTELIDGLKERGILAVFHYVPLHLSRMGRRWGYRTGDLPVTEDLSERLVRLPFFDTLSDDHVARVADAVLEVARDW